jgi:hypothetical protein
MEEMNISKIFVGTPEENRPLDRTRHRCKITVKMYPLWIGTLRFQKTARSFISWATIRASKEGPYSMELVTQGYRPIPISHMYTEATPC